MPLTLLHSETGEFDLSTDEEVFGYTANQNRRCQIQMEVEHDDNFPAGTWELKVDIGGFTWDGGKQSKTGQAVNKVAFTSMPFIMRDEQLLQIFVKGPPGIQDEVTVSVWLYDLESIDAQSFTVTIPEPGQTTGYAVCYDESGDPEAGVEVNCVVRQIPEGLTGVVADNTIRTETSSVDGLIQFDNLFRGVKYSFQRGGSSRVHMVTIPDDAGETYQLPSMIGNP